MTTAQRLHLLLLIVLGLTGSACADGSQLDPGMKAVEQIRGRKFVTTVKNVTIDRADLRKHLEEQMVRTTPYSLEEWGHVLRALQLVDAPAKELLPKLFTLYEAQVLAFYDPQTHTYYSIKQLPNLPTDTSNLVDPKTLEEMVMVHELTHALQDQHFSLSKREKTLMRDTDANMAYHAVLEGEAVLVMLAHMLEKSGVDLSEVVKNDAMLDTISAAAISEGMIDPSTPKYFAEMLKFPYLEGLKFVVNAYRRDGWKALDAVHANPPRSTREVLHPDEYYARVAAAKPAKACDEKKPADALAVEHLGEFHWAFLVGENASRGWVTDRAVIWKDGRVAIDTTWESPERATAFADAYAAFLKNRSVDAKFTRDGATVKVTYTAK